MPPAPDEHNIMKQRHHAGRLDRAHGSSFGHRVLTLLMIIIGVWPGAVPAQAAPPGTVVVWGSHSGVTYVPDMTAIAAGASLSLALKSDGRIVAWGYNGDVLTNVLPGLSNVSAIAAGGGHAMALRSDGTVAAWGRYAWDGLATTAPAGLSNVTAVAGGYSHSVALKSNGTVVAWGDNGFGQTNVPAGLSNVRAIAAGLHTTVALKSNGTVVGWGWWGVPDGLSNVTAIASSSSGFTLALKADGTVVAWGYNDYGQTDVPLGLSNVTAIAAGGECPEDCWGSSAALKSDGTVVVWGHNFYGQTNVPPGLTNVTAIAVGAGYIVALLDYAPRLPSLKVKTMGHELILSWPTNAVGFNLQSTLRLNPPVTWIEVTNAPALLGAQWTVTNTASGSGQFYRLRKQ